jgi:hypothetical protein
MAARYIRDQASRARAAMRPTVQVKVTQAALLAVALGTVAGFAVFLLVLAVLHRAPLAAVLGGAVLYVFWQQLRQLAGWWQHGDRAREPIPICWEIQLLSTVVAGLLWAWLRVLLTAWLKA